MFSFEQAEELMQLHATEYLKLKRRDVRQARGITSGIRAATMMTHEVFKYMLVKLISQYQFVPYSVNADVVYNCCLTIGNSVDFLIDDRNALKQEIGTFFEGNGVDAKEAFSRQYNIFSDEIKQNYSLNNIDVDNVNNNVNNNAY